MCSSLSTRGDEESIVFLHVFPSPPELSKTVMVIKAKQKIGSA